MIAGDTILGGITPAIGLYPNSRPDPLGDYLETLHRIEALAPRIAYAGHKEPILDPAGPCAGDHRAPPRAARRHRGGARRRAALGVRRLARALRARPVADAPAVRDRRVARASRAPRAGGARGAGRPPLRPRLSRSMLTAPADTICGNGAVDDRRSRRAGKLPRARSDAAAPRRADGRGAQARAARRARRARDPGRRVDDVHAPDAPLRPRRGAARRSTGRSSARARG